MGCCGCFSKGDFGCPECASLQAPSPSRLGLHSVVLWPALREGVRGSLVQSVDHGQSFTLGNSRGMVKSYFCNIKVLFHAQQHQLM